MGVLIRRGPNLLKLPHILRGSSVSAIVELGLRSHYKAFEYCISLFGRIGSCSRRLRSRLKGLHLDSSFQCCKGATIHSKLYFHESLKTKTNIDPKWCRSF